MLPCSTANLQVVLGVLMARPGAADTSTREAALGVIRALCTQRGAIHKPNVVRHFSVLTCEGLPECKDRQNDFVAA